MFDGLSSLAYLNPIDEISELSSESFSGLGELETLNLKCNRISDLSPFAFDRLPALKEIVISDNLLTCFKSNVFAKLECIWSLSFDANPIEEIEDLLRILR